MEHEKSIRRLGILGDGQLAQMLAQKAGEMGFQVIALASSKDTPVALSGAEIVVGSFTEKTSLVEFLRRVEVVVFENEFIDCERIREVHKHYPAVRFVPSLDVMERFRDKLTQKKVVSSLGLRTAKFEPFLLAGKKSTEALSGWLEELLSKFGECVLKWGRFGYDGKGVFVLSESNREAALIFCETALSRGVSLFAEEKIEFVRELAILGVQSITGEFSSYPLVVSEQQNGICHRVTGPATALGVSPSLEEKAKNAVSRLAKEMNLLGVFAVEFFQTANHELLINEIAPRVHNTGHYTQDGARTSQFENHWRAALGLPLGSVDTAPAFAMLNILGPSGVERSNSEISLPAPESPVHLHWYGKSKITPGRKLGHLNAAGEVGGLANLLRALDECRRCWEEGLKKNEKK